MWDGHPELDRRSLFSRQAVEGSRTEMPETAVCPYDGVTYTLTEGHDCQSRIPGNLIHLIDGTWAFILDITEDTVTYYPLPPAMIRTAKLSDLIGKEVKK